MLDQSNKLEINSSLDKRWEKKYQQLVNFKNLYGHFNIPFHDEKWLPLAMWAHYQKLYYNNGRLKPYRFYNNFIHYVKIIILKNKKIGRNWFSFYNW